VRLSCKLDAWFEYCTWRHNGQLCQFEWKRSSNAVLMQTCMGIHSRVKYVGNYTAHECEIEVSNVSSDDSGVWSCDVESYVLGATSGYKAQKELTLTIKSPTTTTITTTTATTSSTTTKSTTSMTVSTETSTELVEKAIIPENVESLSDLEKVKKLGRGIDTNVTAIYENDSRTATAGASYVSIILASAAAVFVVLIIAVFFVYKRHKNGYKNKHAKVTMNELESEQFANQMADDEWPNNETNPELSKFNLSVDAEVDSRPPSFKYIGATSYDIQDNNIIKTQK